MNTTTKVAGATLAILLLASGVARADLVRVNDQLSPGDFLPDAGSDRVSPGDMFGNGGSGSPEVVLEERSNPTIDGPLLDIGGGNSMPYYPIDINGTQVEQPGTIYPKTKTYTPTITFGGAGPGGNSRTIDIAVACEVAGTPTEFPDDLVLINRGATLDAGTTIMWKVKSADQGYVRLNRDLPAGGTVKASGVLGGGIEAGKPCSAKVI